MQNRRLNLGTLVPLGLASLIANGLVVGRFVLSGQRAYSFMVWNLLLAWVPIGFALIAQELAGGLRGTAKPMRLRPQLVGLAAFSLGWLLFFPNAPYLATDLVHLRGYIDNGLRWYDTAMFASFALLGVALGCLSLLTLQDMVVEGFRSALERFPGVRRAARGIASGAGWLFALGTLALGSYGMYLGRVMRWNSWDTLLNPDDVAASILGALINRPSSPGMFKITAVFCALLFVAYATSYAFTRGRQQTRTR